ncbi:hypothetical protein KBB96_00260 [Luteolibacter ambystomatis]|uniref:AsmA family protein n=1 Tax=Luteolibacter ambystomatis TaxID=2824561 RepID=A0A975G8K6_9BACT|nr:hypothetical protein [Luteolibacter ambystomatis]QUE51349.1 hypothetical protein KBB96_00260 [Luteolibacter ambystomatis]
MKRGWMGRITAVLGVGAFLILVLAYVGVRRYLHSEGFRVLLSEQASRVLGVPGQFSPFHWDGLQVDTSAFSAEGEGEVKNLRADNLHLEVGLNGVTKGEWHVRGANVGRIAATYDARPGTLTRQEVKDTHPPVDEHTAEAKKNGWLPSEIVLDDLTIQELNGRVLLSHGEASVAGMQVKVEPAGPKRAYRANVQGGKILVPWRYVPPVTVDHLKLRYQDKEIFLTDAVAKVGSRGQLTADGEWNGLTGAHAFNGKVADLACAEILSETWVKRLSGTVDSTFMVEGRRGDTQAHGRLSIQGGTLTALPFLDVLSAYADTRRFRVIQLTDAHADWAWQKDAIDLDKVVLASEGLIRLEGNLKIRGEALDGQFMLGLMPGTLATIPGAETVVFQPGPNGLLWAPLRITGTLADPKEDLSDRLIAAAGIRMLEVLPETGQKVLKFTQQVVGDNPSKTAQKVEHAVEKGVKALDKASGVVNQASGILNGLLGNDPPPPPPAPDDKEPEKK